MPAKRKFGMKLKRLFSLIVITFALNMPHVYGAEIPTPEAFFGHKPGADFKILRWDK